MSPSHGVLLGALDARLFNSRLVHLKKPIIYFQFDFDEFFSGDHMCKKGDFDYERDGFGEVEYDRDSVVDRIIEYMKNDCRLKPEYLERIDNYFAYNDKNNCKRIVGELLMTEVTSFVKCKASFAQTLGGHTPSTPCYRRYFLLF